MAPSSVQTINTYVVLRLGRWRDYVRWQANGTTSHPGPKNPKSWWGLILEGNVEQIDIVSTRDVCPVNAEEARETDKCVRALPDHLLLVVWEEYIICGSIDEKAAALAIEKRAFRQRLSTAHNLLLGLFNDAAAGMLE